MPMALPGERPSTVMRSTRLSFVIAIALRGCLVAMKSLSHADQSALWLFCRSSGPDPSAHHSAVGGQHRNAREDAAGQDRIGRTQDRRPRHEPSVPDEGIAVSEVGEQENLPAPCVGVFQGAEAQGIQFLFFTGNQNFFKAAYSVFSQKTAKNPL